MCKSVLMGSLGPRVQNRALYWLTRSKEGQTDHLHRDEMLVLKDGNERPAISPAFPQNQRVRGITMSGRSPDLESAIGSDPGNRFHRRNGLPRKRHFDALGLNLSRGAHSRSRQETLHPFPRRFTIIFVIRVGVALGLLTAILFRR